MYCCPPIIALPIVGKIVLNYLQIEKTVAVVVPTAAAVSNTTSLLITMYYKK